jgi:DNA polymerase-3 subunit delta'
MFFNKIIGQQTTIDHLTEMVQQNRLSHALLFLGKEGCGALPLAIAFANYVCTRGEYESPAAQNAEKLMHPDIHYAYPVVTRKPGEKPLSTDYIKEWRSFISTYPYGNVYDWLQSIGAENKQGNISAEECNDIIRKLNLKSFESSYKVLVLWMPEYLGKEGNKLLKLIEEPPADTLFILVAESEEQILPTILSRCQLVKIPLPDTHEIEQALVSRAGAPAEAARQIAGICEGNYREALHLYQHTEEDWQAELKDWLNAVVKGGPLAQVKWIDEMTKHGREKQKQFLRYFNHLLEQSIRLRILAEMAPPMPDSEKDFALRLNKITGVSQQQAIIEELDKAAFYIERNAHGKMLFHALTIKLKHIIQDKALFLAD